MSLVKSRDGDYELQKSSPSLREPAREFECYKNAVLQSKNLVEKTRRLVQRIDKGDTHHKELISRGKQAILCNGKSALARNKTVSGLNDKSQVLANGKRECNSVDSVHFKHLEQGGRAQLASSDLVKIKSRLAERKLSNSSRFLSRNELLEMLYKNGIKNFQCGFYEESIVSRESEINIILDTLTKSLGNCGSNINIYICGAPGTGKTCSVLKILQLISHSKALRTCMHESWSPENSLINGALIHSTQDFVKALTKKLFLDKELQNQVLKTFKEYGFDETCKKLAPLISENNLGKKIILVIDEADHIKINESPKHMTRKQTRSLSGKTRANKFLEIIFSLSCSSNSNLIIIAISNSLIEEKDFYNRASAKKETNFKSLIFNSYDEDGLRQILRKRINLTKVETLNALQDAFDRNVPEHFISLVNNIEIIDNVVLTMTLKKIATTKGDCREMLNVCRRMLSERLDRIRKVLETPSVEREQDKVESFHEKHAKNKCSKGFESESTFYSSPNVTPRKSHWEKDSIETGHLLSASTNSSDSDEPIDKILKETNHEIVGASDRIKISIEQFSRPKTKYLSLFKHFPLHQQLLISAVCLLVSEKKSCNESRIISVKDVQERYLKICQNHRISAELNVVNFSSAFTSLEQAGVISLQCLSPGPRSSTATRNLLRRPKKSMLKRMPSLKMQNISDACMGSIELKLSLEDTVDILCKTKMIFRHILLNKINMDVFIHQ